MWSPTVSNSLGRRRWATAHNASPSLKLRKTWKGAACASAARRSRWATEHNVSLSLALSKTWKDLACIAQALPGDPPQLTSFIFSLSLRTLPDLSEGRKAPDLGARGGVGATWCVDISPCPTYFRSFPTAYFRPVADLARGRYPTAYFPTESGISWREGGGLFAVASGLCRTQGGTQT